MHKHETSQQFVKKPGNNHNESTMYNDKTFISSPDAAILCPYCLPQAILRLLEECAML